MTRYTRRPGSIVYVSLQKHSHILPPLASALTTMDTLFLYSTMASPKPKSKRHCCSPPDPNPNPNPIPIDPIDSLLESFLGLYDSSNVSLDLSFDRLLDSRPSDVDRNDMIERALRLGSLLLEAGKRSSRKRDSMHNAVVWPLPSDLTIKVFSFLDTQSVCHAAATCSFFRKCAVDPLCYADLDLTTLIPKVNNMVVSTMIQRAGKSLQSLKLGIVPGRTASLGTSHALVYSMRNSTDASGFSWNDKRSRQGKESFVLSRSCLAPLSADGCSMGALLRKLHLYNIERMDNTALCAALSSCPSLLDLEIVGLHVEPRLTLESVSKYCPLLERLFFESSKTGRDDSLKMPTCGDLVKNCPHLTSLALRGFKLYDHTARVLVKGFRELKYVDFSTSYSITGAFLKNLGGSSGGNLLEVLILRDCMHLKEMEVARFLSAIIVGDFRHLRHLDISNRDGLASEGDWYRRVYDTNFIPVAELFKERPNLCLLADFPSCPIEIEQMSGSNVYSDTSSPSEPSTHTSDGGFTISSFESGDNSDQGSGNDDSRDSNFAIYDESSDEVDFLTL